MLWNTVLIVALGFSQILASPVETKYEEVDYIENVLKAIDAEPTASRIVSGWEAYPGQIPHQVSLRMVNGAGDVSSCGGSVVHRSWVLTAAHCTALRITLVIRAGVTHVTRPNYIAETTTWHNHPTFNDGTPSVVQPNDIAIVELRVPITFNNLAKPIRIQSSEDASRDYAGEVVVASGWGRTWTLGAAPETLNWVYLRAVSNPICAATFGSALITANSICAQFYNVTSQSTCQGDSGGPLVHVGDDGVPTLIGVTSFVAGGEWGCHSGLPAGFIRAGPFHSWLTEVTGLDFENLEEEEEVTEAPELPITTEAPEPPATTEIPEPPITEEPEPPVTTEIPEPPTTEEPESPITTETPDSNESGEDTTEAPEEDKNDSDGQDSSDSEDPELSELLKRLQIKVSVKVNLNKYKKVIVKH